MLYYSESEKFAKRKKFESMQRLKQVQAEEDQNRQYIREQRLKEWFNRKKEVAAVQLEQLRLQQHQEVDKPIDPNASMKNYNAWLQKKLKYEKACREQRCRDAELQSEYDRLRKELAQCHYEKWLETARGKPKPVPLNQGLLSIAFYLFKIIFTYELFL